MKPLTIILPLALFALPAGATLVANVDMTFTTSTDYSATGTYDWPDTPDQGNILSADFEFNSSSNTWNLNDGSTTILREQGSGDGGRFFVGNASAATLTITSDSGVPGQLSARSNSYAAMRIGNHPGTVDGTVNIAGGVTVDIGYIWSASTGNAVNVLDGELAVIVGESNYRFRNIDVTLGTPGVVWMYDPLGDITDAASFLTYTSANSLSPTTGQLLFTNGISRTTIDGGATLTGTYITVIPEPSTALLMGGFLMLGAIFLRRR